MQLAPGMVHLAAGEGYPSVSVRPMESGPPDCAQLPVVQHTQYHSMCLWLTQWAQIEYLSVSFCYTVDFLKLLGPTCSENSAYLLLNDKGSWGKVSASQVLSELSF